MVGHIVAWFSANHLPLDLAFLLPIVDEACDNLVRLLEEVGEDAAHLPSAIVLFDDGLMLVNNHGDALEKGGECGDVVQRRGGWEVV